MKNQFYAPDNLAAQRLHFFYLFYCNLQHFYVHKDHLSLSHIFLCQKEERILGEERAAELSRLTGMFILRRTQEIINRYLPPRLDWTLFCEPSALQLELYRRLLCHQVFRACLQSSTQSHTHLACITALKKLCNHPALLHSTVKVICLSCIYMAQRKDPK